MRLGQLGDLAVKRKWDQQTRQIFHTKMDELAQIQQEADNVNNYHLTRLFLAQEQSQLPQLPGVLRPVVVAAYPSEADLKQDFTLVPGSKEFEAANLAVLLSHRLAFPIAKPNDEDTLKRTIDLVKDSDFPQKRRDLYDWQEQIINQEYTAKDAMIEMEQLIDDYNRSIKKAFRDVYIKYVCTVATLAFSIVGGAIINPLLAAGAIVPLVQLITVDGRPVMPSEKSRPAAMFHDVKKALG